MTSTSPAISAVEVLRSLEWAGESYGMPPYCPVCKRLERFGQHEPDCRLAAALSTVTAGPSDEVAELRAALSKAEADRDALLQAGGWKPGPLTEARSIVLKETAGRLPAMVEARRERDRFEADAQLWQMSVAEGIREPLLVRVWQQKRAATNRATTAEAALAEARGKVERLGEATNGWKGTAERLHEAIQMHRMNVWGNGSIGHEEDLTLYAALKANGGGDAG